VDVFAPLLTIVAIVLIAWLVLVVVLWLHRPSRDRAAVVLRLVPDIARLTVRLARDPATPRRYRIALFALAGYLALPLDLVPDFLPGIGALDDVILAALVLRWVGRGVGQAALEAHWAGSPEGLSLLRRALDAG
jgi:uncharacterized membrane protein YkvA (DUF1232 family)